MDSRVKFRLVSDPSRHQSSTVEGDHHRLVAFDLILPGRQSIASGRRCPRNMSKLVAPNIIAHRFKLAALTASDCSSLYRQERTCAERLQLDLPCAAHIGINLYRLRFTEARLTPYESEPRFETHGRLAKFIPS